MQLLAPLQQHGVVGDLLRERVLEGVFDVADRRLLVDELAELQIDDQPFELVLRLSRDRPGQAEHELAAEHRQGLQQILLVVVQPVDARGENCLHRGRDPERGERLDEPRSLPFSRCERAFVEQRLHRLLHEEGRAAGRLDDDLLERQQDPATRPASPTASRRRCSSSERLEPHLLAIGLSPQRNAYSGRIVHQQQELSPWRASRRADRARPGFRHPANADPRR